MTNGVYNMYPDYQVPREQWVSGLGHAYYPVTQPELTPQQRSQVAERVNTLFNPVAEVELVEVTDTSNASQ